MHSSTINNNNNSNANSFPNFMTRNKRNIENGDASLPVLVARKDTNSTLDSDSSAEESKAPKASMRSEFSIEIPLHRNAFKATPTTTLHNGSTSSHIQKTVELSSDEEETKIMLPTPRRTQSAAPMGQMMEASESDEVDASPMGRSQRQAHQIVTDENDDDDDDIVLPTPAKRKRQDDDADITRKASSPAKRLRTRKEMHQSSESEGLPIKPTAQEKSRTNQGIEPTSSQRTTRQRIVKRHRTDREKTMELLRRKRAGEKITQLTDSESGEEEPHQAIYDSNSELEVLSQFDDEEESAQAIESVRQSIRGQNRNTYDEDFVVEDDENDAIGAPGIGLNDIPLEFTRQAHKPLKEHFKDCVEWMVHKKINPGFNINDPLYKNSFLKMSDEVRGLANSKFMSSIWKQDFALALQARPIFNEAELASGESMIHMHCDACNRNHPTRYILQFTGKPYNIDTLEDIEKDDETDEENEEEGEEDVDSQGRIIPKPEKTWYVGRFCKANAETSHSLLHWKWALNNWVVDQLTNEKQLKPKKLAEREKWSMKKRGREANRIVDTWEAGRQIKELYRDFKANLESARSAVQTRTKTSRD